ncbi:MAG: fumarylacetoacetate hydrolase family protein [Pseudomonadota bacterium]
MNDVVAPPPPTRLAVAGGGAFPVRRIFCVGKNFSDHVAEMGGDPAAARPVFFTKPADAATQDAVIPSPPATEDLHFEGELVVALARGGADLDPAAAAACVFGFAAGCDLTRRDLQAAAKKAGAPWDAAKAFDAAAPIGAIAPVTPETAFEAMRLATDVNGVRRQDAPLSAMTTPVPELLAAISRLFVLRAGDVVFTGTPSGVGPLAVGDAVRVEVTGAPALAFSIGARTHG